MDDEAILTALTKVRGIGRWTVQTLLLFQLGRPDVLPVADSGIRKGYAKLIHHGAQKEVLATAKRLKNEPSAGAIAARSRAGIRGAPSMRLAPRSADTGAP